MHHIRKLNNSTKNILDTGFDAIIGSINRKQIPICKSCHTNIHSGIYDGKALKEILNDIQYIDVAKL